MRLMKRILAFFPEEIILIFKRIYFVWQIKEDKFTADEPEFFILEKLVSAGDLVVDIGANVGHYSSKLSQIVGPKGRVFAIEPIPETFSLLVRNSRYFSYSNVSLLNIAISDCFAEKCMFIPYFDTGLKNLYRAHIGEYESSGLSVISLPLDDMAFHKKVSLVKIDAEGHEASVIAGMKNIIEKDKPTLIVETSCKDIRKKLKIIGYREKILRNSPNILFIYQSDLSTLDL